ncbi:zinc-ribbon domain-containing protein [Yinghuangia seranimata]|uniref:zinc-ribbon domain-containing protein n=1 Tax=Yinghuangia seranimata TaxID=408067 RepID=UPI00248AEE87|nr:zinc-ribbon domain-containing protein [Yinghuangia seranimata]MDI2128068.1 zinc-ribbon domain-containing protein [Yinghuangia seranimata]
MLIWGFKTLFKVLSEGVFHCPRCGVDRAYRLRLARRWFTLFFIPVFPYRTDGNHVECQTCKGTFYESVLQRPTSGQLSQDLANGMRLLALDVLRASGTPSTAARTAAVKAVVEAGLPDYSMAALDAELAAAPVPSGSVLVPLGQQLEAQGREWLLTRGVRIAAADGGIGSAEREVLDRCGAFLQMTVAHVAGVVDTVQRNAAQA